MPLFVIKVQAAEKTVIHGPYAESSFENIRRSAQIASAKGKDTRELVWKCGKRPAAILYVYHEGKLIFPKGTPGDRNSKRGKATFSCVSASGDACKLPVDTKSEDAVKGRRKNMNITSCPVKFTVVSTPTAPGPRKPLRPKAASSLLGSPPGPVPVLAATPSPCPPCAPCGAAEAAAVPRASAGRDRG